jgi:hypothetical protein
MSTAINRSQMQPLPLSNKRGKTREPAQGSTAIGRELNSRMFKTFISHFLYRLQVSRAHSGRFSAHSPHTHQKPEQKGLRFALLCKPPSDLFEQITTGCYLIRLTKTIQEALKRKTATRSTTQAKYKQKRTCKPKPQVLILKAYLSVDRAGVEPATPGFSVQCSTN